MLCSLPHAPSWWFGGDRSLARIAAPVVAREEPLLLSGVAHGPAEVLQLRNRAQPAASRTRLMRAASARILPSLALRRVAEKSSFHILGFDCKRGAVDEMTALPCRFTPGSITRTTRATRARPK